jgi:hypothetical protein
MLESQGLTDDPVHVLSADLGDWLLQTALARGLNAAQMLAVLRPQTDKATYQVSVELTDWMAREMARRGINNDGAFRAASLQYESLLAATMQMIKERGGE